MFKIKVERILDKPIDEVFNAISDHASYSRFPGIHESKLLIEGVNDANGEGALRKIRANPFTFIERITHFDRPHRIRYIIEKSSPLAMRHQVGDICLFSENNKTRVIWISEGYLKLPIFGPSMDKIAQRQATHTFNAILRHIER